VASGKVDHADLERHASNHLARYKCPRIYSQVEALPKGPNGKLFRRRLREAYEKTAVSRE